MTLKQKQALLAYLGYYDGQLDGIWGEQSQRSTIDFQRDFGGISVDGICGEQTEKALKHSVAYGIDKKSDSTDYTADYTDVQNNNTGNSTDSNTGTFWDEIQYFTREEFRCQCNGKYCNGFPVEPSEKLIRLADKVRGEAGRPMVPTSTVRCRAHNKAVGGVENSRHLEGKAMDFSIRGWSADRTLALVWQQKDVRYAYAIDGTHVHMDIA